MKKCAVIYNPVSGRKAKFKQLSQFEKILNDYGYEVKITSDDIIEFILVAIKEKADITPRSIIRDFIEVLNLSFQNGNASIKQIMDTFKYSDDVENLEDIEE